MPHLTLTSPRPHSTRVARRGAAVGAVIAAALAISGCTAGPSLVPFADREADVLYVGDCVSQPDLDALSIYPEDRLPCETPHNVEIVGLLADYDGEPLPPSGEQDAEFFPQCFEQIAATITEDTAGLPLIASYTGQLADDDTIDGPVLCVLMTRLGDVLEDSVFVTAPDKLLGEWRLLASLEPGTCFDLGDQYNLGKPGDCEPGTLMYLGVIEAEGDEEWPGVDELRRQRDLTCTDLLVDDDRIDADTLSGTIPGRSDWLAGSRTITCDVEVV